MSATQNAAMLAMVAELEALKAKNAELEAAAKLKASGALNLYAGPSGTICIGGLRKGNPLSAYYQEWCKVEEIFSKIHDYYKANPDKCSTGKDDRRFDAAKAASKAAFEAKQAKKASS